MSARYSVGVTVCNSIWGKDLTGFRISLILKLIWHLGAELRLRIVAKIRQVWQACPRSEIRPSLRVRSNLGADLEARILSVSKGAYLRRFDTKKAASFDKLRMLRCPQFRTHPLGELEKNRKDMV